MKPKDRDIIQTTDNHLFVVVGYLHPPDGYSAYLKYIPSSDGKWERDGQRFSRTLPFYQVGQVENTYDYLGLTNPEYLFDCMVRNITMSWVPKTNVKTYYEPIKRLKEILGKIDGDDLEKKLAKLVEILSDSGVDLDSIGVTGSILTGTHNPSFSDIDLTIYGQTDSRRTITALDTLKGSEKITAISETQKKEWIKARSERFPLSTDDLRRIAEKRWNYGYIEDTYFSIHPTRTDDEITEEYGDNTFHRLDSVTGSAVVSDNSESIYLPAIYGLEEVETDIEAPITKLVSFEGLYGSLFEVGDKIEFNGILEEIMGINPGFRVLVGGAGSPESYVKWSYSG